MGAQALLGQSDETLRAVDALRYPWPSFQMETRLVAKGQSQRWRVTVSEGRDARVEGLSEKEKGRTVLLLGEDMWLLLPTAKRPIKVSPQQRLLGPAAGGDLARSAFAEDYDVKHRVAEELDGTPAWRLDLEAKRPASSYRRVTLWVAKGGGHPLKAAYFLASGKLARTAIFAPPAEARGRRVLSRLEIEEPGGTRTEIHFEHWAPTKADPERFRLPNTE